MIPTLPVGIPPKPSSATSVVRKGTSVGTALFLKRRRRFGLEKACLIRPLAPDRERVLAMAVLPLRLPLLLENPTTWSPID
jgi:hypothetical protein